MKIIDFEKKGNLVRFYLGDDDCENYTGDDWDDAPYEHNAGRVNDEYIKCYQDVAFPFEYEVMEPCDGEVLNSPWSKDDMKARRVPCIVAAKDVSSLRLFTFDRLAADDNAVKFHFGDEIIPTADTVIYRGRGDY